MLGELEVMLSRSWRYVFSVKKLVMTALFLLAILTIFAFCQILSLTAGKWMQISLFFLPVFVSAGFMMALAIFACKIYWRQIKGKTQDYKALVRRSWELFLASSFVSVPLFLVYIGIWALLGIFYLIKEIPLLGGFLGALLSFGPFLLIFLTLALTVATLILLFIAPPALALESKDSFFWRRLLGRIASFFPTYTILFIIGVVPLLLVVALLATSWVMTDYLYFESVTPLLRSFQYIILEIPIALFMTIPFLFFVHFSFESHLYLVRRQKELVHQQDSRESSDHAQ